MSKNITKHFTHAISAIKWSCAGIIQTAKTETAFQQEIITLIALPIVGWFLGCSFGHIMLLVAAWLAVMIIELLNSAVESLCDLISPEYNIYIKRAKDAGSAAVMLSLIANLCFWFYLIYLYW